MATLQDAELKMQQAEQKLQPYENPNLSMNVQKKVMQSWSPLLNRAAKQASNAMASFGKDFANLPYGQYVGGTEATDLPIQAKIEAMYGGASKLGARVDKAGRIGDYLGGKAADMAQRAQEAMKFGYTAAAQKYDRARNLYQTLWQENEAQKNRDFQAAQAAASRAAQANQYQGIQGLLDKIVNGQVAKGNNVAAQFGETGQARVKESGGVLGLNMNQMNSLLKEVMTSTGRSQDAEIFNKYLALMPEDQRTERNMQRLADITQGRATQYLKGY